MLISNVSFLPVRFSDSFICRGDEFFVTASWGPCWECGEPCNTIELCFGARLHPGRCTKTKNDEYWSQA